MRIAFFTDSYRPTHDGVAHFVAALADALGRQGHEVRVYTALTPDAPRHAREGNVDVRRHRSAPLPYYPQYRWSIWPYSSALRSTFARDVDVVHVHTPGPVGTAGVMAARRHGVPLVGTFHTNLKEMQRSLPDTALLRTFFRTAWIWNAGIYARCQRVTVPVAAAKSLLEGSFRKPSLRAPVDLVPNGVDTTTFRPGLREPDWGARLGAPEVPRILFLGRLTRDKGIHTLLDAVKLMPKETPFLCVIAGDGPEREAVQARLKAEAELAGRVRYIGPVSDEDKPALLSQSRCFVLPSVADIAPITMLEAMASGCLCVAAKDGGPAELLDGGTAGLLVDPRDPGDVANTITRALTANGSLAPVVARAREKVERTFSIDRTARELVGVYDLVRASRPAAMQPA